jgi:FAD/FMN-containing dehydrogenase
MTLEIFSPFSPLLPGMEGYDSYLEDVVMKALPEAVLRPSSIEELQEIIRLCHRNGVCTTVCGNQTSVTGASVTDKGILVSTEKLNKIEKFELLPDGTATVTAQCGVLLSTLQDECLLKGYHYPPDPTSREEVLLGGTIATNATGEDSYFYGSTRNYILSLDIITPEGNLLTVKRNKNPLNLPKIKNLCGYYLSGEEIDYYIDSEGTLGIIASATLLLMPAPGSYHAMILFFEKDENAFQFICHANHQRNLLNLRALEYADQHSTNIMKENSSQELPQDCCSVYLKFEPKSETESEKIIDLIMELSLISENNETLLEQALFASDSKELRAFRQYRHAIPSTVNELARRGAQSGGGKSSSDWWVPLEHLVTQMNFVKQQLSRWKGSCFIFGHLGNGHPHVNLVATSKEEKLLALEILKLCTEHAVSLGGGACGEHGVGKLKKWALPMQWTNDKLDFMKNIKQRIDPLFRFAPDNIFSNPDGSIS